MHGVYTESVPPFARALCFFMKPKYLPSFRSVLFPIAISLACGGFSQGQNTLTWNGGDADDDNWSSADNWNGTAPSGNEILTFSGSTRLNPINDITGYGGYRILFDSGASAFTLSGNDFTLYDYGGNSPKIENNSSNLQTIQNNLTLDGTTGGVVEINPVDGDLLLGGTLTLADNAILKIWGNNGKTVTFNGAIGQTGTSSMVLEQNSTVVLGADNSFSGGITINAGTLRVGNGGTTGTLGSGSVTNNSALIFNRSNDLTVSNVISGSGSLAKQGGGTLTLSGANTFTGAVTVNNGILKFGSTGALGANSGITVASGARVDLGGQLIGNTNNYSWTIAGDGGDGAGGLGAIYNTGADIYEDSSVKNLTLSGNAEIGGNNGRFDIGRDGSNGSAGTIDGAGFTLTKTGSNAIVVRAPASNITYVVNQGSLTFEDYNTASGANDITVNNTASLGTYGARTISNNVTLNSGTTLHNNGGGTGTWSGTISAGNGVTISAGGQMVFSGAFSSTGNVTKSGSSGVDFTNSAAIGGAYTNQAGTTRFQTGANALGGTLTISAGEVSIENSATNTFSAVNLNAGTLRIKSNNNALGSATLAVGGNSTLASQSGSSALTFSNNATIAGTSTLSVDAGYAAITWNGNITGTGTKVGTASSGTLTLGGTVNMGSNITGTVSVDSGATLVLSSTASVTAGTVSNTSTGILNINGAAINTSTLRLSNNGTINYNSGTSTVATVALNNQTGNLNIAGGTLNAGYFSIGDAGSTSGRITQTGGTVNVTGANGIRIGHWDNGSNAGSVYNISGGLLDASSTVINVGWDGAGTLNVSGTGVVKTGRLYVDAAGADKPGIVNLQTGGRIEIGSSGTSNDGTTGSQINLAGGTMAGTANATWASRMDANASTTSTLEVGTGFTVTQSGILQGSGNITKTGAGIFALSNTGNTFTGKYNVTGGTLSVGADTHFGAVPGAVVADYITLTGSTLRLTAAMTMNTNRGITIASGATVNSASAGSGSSVTIASTIAGSGGLILAANGDTSATGGGSGGSLKLSGTNTFTGDVRITSGVVDSDSNFGNAANNIILDGGGLVDKNLNVNLTRNIQVGAGGGVFRAYGSVTNGIIAGNVSNVSGVTSTTLSHTDGGTLKLAGSGAGFTGTFNNQRGALQITANNANWANTDFLQDTNGSTITFNGGGTASIRSLSSTRDVFVQNGMTLKVGAGGITMSTNGHWWQTSSGTVGNLTSSTGTLTVTNGAASGSLTTTDHRINLKIVNDGANPVALVKNNYNSLVLSQANTHSGGTTINGGRITADNLSAFGTGTVTVNSGGQAYLTQSGTYANAFTLAGNGVTEAAGALGAIRFTNNTIGGNVTIASGGARVVGYLGNNGTIAGNLLGIGNLEINIAGNSSANGTISLTGSGSSHTGTISVSGGRFNMGTALGGSVIVADGATLGDEGNIAGNLTLGSTTGSTLALTPSTPGRITAGGNLVLNGVTSLNFSGAFGSTGLINLATYSGSLTDGNGGTLTDSFSIANPADFRTFTVTNDSGTLKLDLGRQSVVWTGTTNNSWESQGSATNWNSTDSLFINTDVVTFNDTASNKAVTISGTVSPDSTTFDNSTGNDYTVSGGGIGGTGSLTKTNSGTVTFTSNNTYTGAVSIQAGSVRVGDGGTNGTLGGTGSISISSGSTLAYDRSDAVNLGRAAISGGTLVQDGGGTLRLGQVGNNVNITVNNGTFQALDGGWASSYFSTPNRVITVNDGGTFVTATHTLGGLGGTFNRPDMVINQGGTWQLNGEQYFSAGDLTLNGGSINVATNDLRLDAGTAIIGASTTGSTISGNAITLYASPTFQVANGSAAKDLGISAPINQSAAYGITKTGSGTMALSGASTYSGATNVNAGTLLANNTTGSATGTGTVNVASGAFLGGDGSINGTVSLSGTLLPGQGGTTDRSLTINGNVTTTTGSTLSFTVTSMASHDQLIIGGGSSIGLNNADLVVDFDNSLTFTELGAGEGDDFLAQLDSFSGTGSWFKLISGTTTGMFANVTDTMTAGDLSYFGLSGTQYTVNIEGQTFWVAQGSTYLVAIPEPRAALIGAIGLLMLLRRRR